MTGKKVIVEFQDPLSGENIGRNASAKGYLYLIERFIINQADKIVYVTKFAAAFAKQQFKSPNIHAIYPGAKRFDIQESQKEKKEEKSFFTFVHLGSLYSTRNFDSIISAINQIQEKDKSIIEKVEIINVGHVAQDIKERIEMQPYIRIKELMPREEAINFAAQADVLLLIQNTDNRSNVTIPFKTYDYLNLGNTILGLLNSEELSQIISEAEDKISTLQDELIELEKGQLQIEAEVGPIKYIAEFVYGETDRTILEEAVRWVIIIIVTVFDPLAIALLIAWNDIMIKIRPVPPVVPKPNPPKRNPQPEKPTLPKVVDTPAPEEIKEMEKQGYEWDKETLSYKKKKYGASTS